MTRQDPLSHDSNLFEGDWSRSDAPAGEGETVHPGEPPLASPPAAAPSPPPPVAVPIGWLLERGAGPIQYRTLLELAKVSPVPGRLQSLVYGYPPALTLALTQRPEGTWYNAMLAVPAPRAMGFEGVGTIVAFRRLLEYGWDRDSPPLYHARRLLFRLLAEDNDPSLLFELGEKGQSEEDGVRRARILLREAAAAALAQAGYEGDPRLRGAALRLLQRVITYLRSPLAAEPWTGGSKRALAPGAAPPSYFFLLMLAHMPLFRVEHAKEMDDLLRHLTITVPSHNGGQSAVQRNLVMGDPLADEEATNDIAFATAWLELAARLGYLKRYEPWSQQFTRLLEQCDESAVWRGKRGQSISRSNSPFVWPTFPLGSGASVEDQAIDVTFRLGLIARLSGRTLELV